NPPGSDGRQPTLQQQTAAGLTVNPPTTTQFQTAISFGGLAAPDQSTVMFLDPSKTLVGNAGTIGLPTGSGGGVTVVLSSAKIGAPYLSRQLDYLYGAVISVPDTDENAALLPPTVQKDNYWL